MKFITFEKLKNKAMTDKRYSSKLNFYLVFGLFLAIYFFSSCSENNNKKSEKVIIVTDTATKDTIIKVENKTVEPVDKELEKKKALFVKQEKRKDIKDSVYTIDFNASVCEEENCKYLFQIHSKKYHKNILNLKIGFWCHGNHESFDYCSAQLSKGILKLTLLKAWKPVKNKNGAITVCKNICPYTLMINIKGLKKMPKQIALDDEVLIDNSK
jgi:hypothetical protein